MNKLTNFTHNNHNHHSNLFFVTHIHFSHADGEAKFWLTLEVILTANNGLSNDQINAVKNLVILHYEENMNTWNTHFSDSNHTGFIEWFLAFIAKGRTVSFF